MIDPSFFIVNFFEELFREGDGRAAGRIFFGGMMDLRYPGMVVRMRSHQGGKTFVQFKEDIDPYAEIAGIQKGTPLLGQMLPALFGRGDPAGGAADYGYAGVQAADDIVEGAFRAREFDGGIR